MAPSDQHVAPCPVLVSFDYWGARRILAEIVPWEFRRRRSGHETGTQVLMYASGEVRAVVGAYTAGTVFEYRSLAALKEGVHRSEMARFGENEINEEWLEEVFKHLPRGWAVDICEPRAFVPSLTLGDTATSKTVKGPHGFQYLDLENPDHARLWGQVQASGRS
jgi:predicted transcriptional regulator